MRFMMTLTMDPAKAPTGGPTPEMMEGMAKLVEEMAKAGVLLDTGGLHDIAESTRIVLSGGKQSVIDGPFIEAKEVVGGYAIIQSKSKEEALEWASRFLATHGDEWEVISEIRQIQEPPA